MKIQRRRTWLAAILTMAGAAEMHASIMDTYSFIQTGYQHSGDLAPGILTGSFTGIVEDSGLIELADLQSFTATFWAGSMWTTTDPVFFSFDTNPGAGASTLGFAAYPAYGDICVGAPAAFAFGDCHAAPPSQPVTGSFLGFFTDVLPTVELISSTTTGPPAQSSVPEPSDALLLGLGLCGLACIRLPVRHQRLGRLLRMIPPPVLDDRL
jgi:hypothetical protein